MGLFGKLLSRLFGRKQVQSCTDVNPPQIQPDSFYRPDTRTETEKEAEKQAFLHPDALDVATSLQPAFFIGKNGSKANSNTEQANSPQGRHVNHGRPLPYW